MLLGKAIDPALERDGYLIARGVTGASRIAEIHAVVHEAYAELDAGRGDPLARGPVRNWGGLPFTVIAGELRELLVDIKRFVREHVGWVWLIEEHSFFRRHVAGATYVPWHVDADAAGTIHYDPCFNFWLPLGAVGINRPSLQFIPGSHKIMREIPPFSSPDNVRSDDWVLERFPGQEAITAILEPGDAVFFDHFTLHRTQPIGASADVRVGSEFRFTCPSIRKVLHSAVRPHRLRLRGHRR